VVRHQHLTAKARIQLQGSAITIHGKEYDICTQAGLSPSISASSVNYHSTKGSTVISMKEKLKAMSAQPRSCYFTFNENITSTKVVYSCTRTHKSDLISLHLLVAEDK
jgi:hypothetical protein